MDCTSFRERIYHFQAGELPDVERLACEGHLEVCPECVRLLDLEDGLLRVVKTRLARRAAPPGLETRIRAALREETSGIRPAAWFRSPWFATAAAVVLLAVLLVPGLGVTPEPGADGLSGVVRIANREVTVVDLECDRAGMDFQHQRDCSHPDHINGLKTADGDYWFVSPDQEGYAAWIHDREMRGRKLVVEGDYYPEIHTLQMQRIQPVARTRL